MKPTWWQREPTVIVAQVQALLAIAAGAGFVISSNTTGTIIAAVTILSTVLGALVVRRKVSSPATVAVARATTNDLLDKASVAVASAGIPSIARLCPAPPPPTVEARDPATGWPTGQLVAAPAPVTAPVTAPPADASVPPVPPN